MLVADVRNAGKARRLAALPPLFRIAAFTFILVNRLKDPAVTTFAVLFAFAPHSASNDLVSWHDERSAGKACRHTPQGGYETAPPRAKGAEPGGGRP